MTQQNWSASLEEFKMLASFFQAFFPNVPIPLHYSLAVNAPNDANGSYMVKNIANQLGLPIEYDGQEDTTWNSVSVTIPLGRITYRVFYVSKHAVARYAASVQPTITHTAELRDWPSDRQPNITHTAELREQYQEELKWKDGVGRPVT